MLRWWRGWWRRNAGHSLIMVAVTGVRSVRVAARAKLPVRPVRAHGVRLGAAAVSLLVALAAALAVFVSLAVLAFAVLEAVTVIPFRLTLLLPWSNIEVTTVESMLNP